MRVTWANPPYVACLISSRTRRVGIPIRRSPRRNQSYNVFNLDPFVWFVHKQLLLSGYGFSFDDDTADVNANGAEQLYVAVGGPEGLPNTNEWKPSTPWGPRSSYADISEEVRVTREDDHHPRQ